MFLLYSFLLTVGFLVLLPRFLFQKKYAAGFRQRFGNLPAFDAEGKSVCWLHCVSVGETNAARPLVRELKKNFPEYKLVISTTTLTGQNLAREIYTEDAELIFYFPFDWKFSVRRALRRINPAIVLLMETEIWFNFVREAGKFGAKVVVVNGRLSEKSASRYALIPKTMQRVLHYFDLVLMQNQKDANRLINLGIRSPKVKVTGNIKFDQATNDAESDLTKEFRQRFAVSKDAPLIVAASTHAPEESFVLDAFNLVYKNAAPEKLPRLLIAPRHPERFAEVAQIIKSTGFNWTRRGEEPSSRDKVAEIILLDSIGELRAIYPLAEIVFVGGSLIPHGGQNILEPAAARKAIVSGFYTMNFEAIIKEFLSQNALIQLPKLAEKDVSAKLAETFAELINHSERRDKLAANAFQVLQSNRGATDKTVEHLKILMQPK
ncbi:MAG: 3-deoxy-D-manno-octulosonic acid transferase [Acidobacteria bacterium]|jgi:3-deoxy-D-manno-octulosonic-acid transferase|nr:3-deoxy-D-manno-octulosonic acid transferase [Acidobacteriota bacterium]MBA4123948.1 3-deoxy-D-manno-octulosonic acid transferase [Acidobacteriota bacterium]